MFSFSVLAQDNSKDEELLDGLYPEEEQESGASGTLRSQDQNQNPIQVECVCPQNEVQEEVAQEPSLFPPGAVFNVNPVPEVPVAPVEKQEESSLPPGYINQLPPGYSNDTYAPAGVQPAAPPQQEEGLR